MTNFMGLPSAQIRCLHAIVRLIEEKGISPTLDEIAEAMQTQEKRPSRQAVYQLVNELAAKGRITRDPHKHRSITVVEKKEAIKK